MTKRLPPGVRALGKRFQARYTGPDGHRYTRTFSTSPMASSWLEHEKRLVDLDVWTPPDKRAETKNVDGITVRQLADRYLEARSKGARPLKQTSADDYRDLFRRRVAPYPIADAAVTELTRRTVLDWRDTIDEDHETPTQNGKASTYLHTLLQYAVEEEIIGSNPHSLKGRGKPARRTEPRVFPPEHWPAYLDALPERWRAASLLVLTTGLRRGEVLGLRWEDVDLEAGIVHVRQAASVVQDADGRRSRTVLTTPKTRAGRRDVPIIPAWVQTIRNNLPPRGEASGPELIWHQGDGSPERGDGWYNQHRKAMRTVGWNVKLHEFRNTFLTLAASQGGATTHELQILGGHSTPAMAMHYQVAVPERLRSVVDRMDERFTKPDA